MKITEPSAAGTAQSFAAIVELEQLEGGAFMPGIIGFLVVVAQRQQGVVTNVDRQAQCIVMLLMPAATRQFIVMPQVRPVPFRQIKLHFAGLGEHRRHQTESPSIYWRSR
nr:Uncharacterised protein [Klebsiella pneumoniae]